MIGSIIHLLRLARAGYVLAHEGVFASVDPMMVPPAARLPLALAKLIARRKLAPGGTRLAAAMGRLGPSYVKLGQFLATRPDVVGPNVVRELEQLQDRVPPFPQERAVQIVEAAFGRPIGEVFHHSTVPKPAGRSSTISVIPLA